MHHSLWKLLAEMELLRIFKNFYGRVLDKQLNSSDQKFDKAPYVKTYQSARSKTSWLLQIVLPKVHFFPHIYWNGKPRTLKLKVLP